MQARSTFSGGKVNHSNPVGLPWVQGFLGPFAAQAGAAESYAAANLESATFGSGGVIDSWLVTPALSLGASNTVTLWTRTIFNPSTSPIALNCA